MTNDMGSIESLSRADGSPHREHRACHHRAYEVRPAPPRLCAFRSSVTVHVLPSARTENRVSHAVMIAFVASASFFSAASSSSSARDSDTQQRAPYRSRPARHIRQDGARGRHQRCAAGAGHGTRIPRRRRPRTTRGVFGRRAAGAATSAAGVAERPPERPSPFRTRGRCTERTQTKRETSSGKPCLSRRLTTGRASLVPPGMAGIGGLLRRCLRRLQGLLGRAVQFAARDSRWRLSCAASTRACESSRSRTPATAFRSNNPTDWRRWSGRSCVTSLDRPAARGALDAIFLDGNII
jgi:hypothetical protein